LLAALIRGYSGFGFSAVLVAGLAFVIEPLAAVPLAIAFEVVASLLQGSSIRSEIRWRDFRILVAAAVVGNPIGLAILVAADADTLRAVTFGVLLILSVGLLVGANRRLPAPTSKLATDGRRAGQSSVALFFVVGVVAGVVNGATAMSGLVLVLAMTFMMIAAAEMRATLIAYFFASNLFVLLYLFWTDEIGSALLWRLMLGLPLMAVGIAVGSKAFRNASVESFHRVTLGLLVAISLVGLLRL